jgi:uncharacterized protein YndB with AHSA1/START domain
MQAQANRDAVVIDIEIEAPPERVFCALTEAKELALWWREESITPEPWEFEARLGGRWKTGGNSKSLGSWETWGEIVEFEPPRVLAMTWHERLDKPRPFGETIVKYELESIPSGTRLRLTHSGFAGYQAAFQDYSKGWIPVMALLRGYCVTHT